MCEKHYKYIQSLYIRHSSFCQECTSVILFEASEFNIPRQKNKRLNNNMQYSSHMSSVRYTHTYI